MGGAAIRAPKMYRQEMKPTDWRFQTVPKTSSALLTHTNETIHPSVRYRHFCQSPEVQDKLGVDDRGPYDPKALDAWDWPHKDSKGPQQYKKKSRNKAETVDDKIQESTLGYWEQILLALYDEGEEIKDVNSIWDQVVGTG